MKVQFDPFIVEYEPITSPILDFKSECVMAVNNALSHNTQNLPVILMMSGGIDSELVGEALLLANVSFRCMICRLLYINHAGETIILNEHDYYLAEKWCLKNNIKVEYCELDIFKESSLISEYALLSDGFSPQLASHLYTMKLCTERGYFFITGHNEIDVVLKDDEYFIFDEQRDCTFDKFCHLYKLNGIYRFWKQDSRLISAYLQLPTVKLLMSKKIKRILDHKHECYADIFQFEPRIKQTGFERIQEWDASIRTPMRKINGKYDSKFYTSITQFQFNQEFL